jgi:serine/threonine-protein kinase
MAPATMPTQSAAFDALLRGRYLLQRRTPDAIDGALRAFRDAVKADSGYAPAYAGLSSAYLLYVAYGYPGSIPPYAAAVRAQALADRAVALDYNLGDGHVARSDALLIGQASPEQALEELRIAQRLLPSSAEVVMSAAHALGDAGRWDAALRQAQRALALDPLSTGLRHSLITLALGARRYDLAIEEARRARAFTPGDRVTAVLQAYALLLSGDPARCVALDLGPFDAVRAMCLQELRRDAEARPLTDSLTARLRAGRYRLVHEYAEMAALNARQGNAARSIEWLKESVKVSPMLHYWHLNSGLFDRVRNDSTFANGLADLEQEISRRLEEERRSLGGRLE